MVPITHLSFEAMSDDSIAETLVFQEPLTPANVKGVFPAVMAAVAPVLESAALSRVQQIPGFEANDSKASWCQSKTIAGSSWQQLQRLVGLLLHPG